MVNPVRNARPQPTIDTTEPENRETERRELPPNDDLARTPTDAETAKDRARALVRGEEKRGRRTGDVVKDLDQNRIQMNEVLRNAKDTTDARYAFAKLMIDRIALQKELVELADPAVKEPIEK